MSDWIRTKVGLQAMENIVRYLPRLTIALEGIAESLKPRWSEDTIDGNEYDEEEDVALGASIVKSNKKVEGVFMSNGKVVNVDYVKDEKE